MCVCVWLYVKKDIVWPLFATIHHEHVTKTFQRLFLLLLLLLSTALGPCFLILYKYFLATSAQSRIEPETFSLFFLSFFLSSSSLSST